MKKYITLTLAAALASALALSANAQSAAGKTGQDRIQQGSRLCPDDGPKQLRDGSGPNARQDGQRRGAQDGSGRVEGGGKRDGSGAGLGNRQGNRQLNGQRRGPQDGSGKAHGGGLRNGTGPCAVDGTCPQK